jgi:hypothetical protein
VAVAWGQAGCRENFSEKQTRAAGSYEEGNSEGPHWDMRQASCVQHGLRAVSHLGKTQTRISIL